MSYQNISKKQKYRKLIETYQNTGDEILRSEIRTELGEMLLKFLYKTVKGMARETLEAYNIPVDEPVNEALSKILEKKLDTIKTPSALEEYSFSLVGECIFKTIAGLYPLSIGDDSASKKTLRELEKLTYNGKGRQFILEKGNSQKG